MSLHDTDGLLQPSTWRPLRLDTLVRLRWLAVGGQTLSIVFVAFGLGFPVALVPCFGLIALSALLNIWMIFKFGPAQRPSSLFAASQLGYDSVQLAGLLALTGGLENPFSILLLAPVAVSGTTLPKRATVVLALLTGGLASILAVWHLPLPWDPQNQLFFDRIYIIGCWVALLCGVAFVAIYTNRVAHEARQIGDALAATELALSRREQLSALDGLAAAAAHELGTPLSTIALAAKEMRAEVQPGPLADDVELIIEQSARCRAILAKLRNLGSDGGDPFASAPITDLLAEVAQPHEGHGAVIVFERGETNLPEPVFARSVGILYGLGNLIENATDFANLTVKIKASWTAGSVTVTINDDGPGFAPELMARLGEPYLTTRARDIHAANADEPGGLGLGIFIAKTLLERTGARLQFRNLSPQGHAQVRVIWPQGATKGINEAKPF